MIITGFLVLFGAYFLFRHYKDRISAVLIGLLGVGALGVGIFPGNINPQHPLFALTTFISGGLSAIYSYRMIKPPFKYFALIFGLFCLGFLFGFLISPNSFIMGAGGVERWVAYPIVLWLLGFGGYLMGLGSTEKD